MRHWSNNIDADIAAGIGRGTSWSHNGEVRKGGSFPIDHVLAWAGVLGEALSFLHDRNPPIIFRNLKPANIMVTPQGTLMLVDFDIARAVQAGGGGGTPGYAPPEQYQGLAESRSDQYALAATLHHFIDQSGPAGRTAVSVPAGTADHP